MKRESRSLTALAVGIIIPFCAVVIISFGYLGPRDVDIAPWIGVAERTGAANIVSSIYLSARLFDTLLEVLVFVVAVLGVRFYLPARGRPQRVESIPESHVVRIAADVLLPLILLIGIYVVVHGHLSPGGGFSGGVIAGTGILFAGIALGTDEVQARLKPIVLQRLEWCVLLCILGLAILPVLFGRPILADLLPKGTMGRLGSAGTVLAFNLLIGIKVFIGSWVIARHFVDHRGEI